MIKQFIYRKTQGVFYRLGLQISRANQNPQGWTNRNPQGWIKKPSENEPLRLYVGSGPDSREGYINCDIRSIPGVQLVCPAWKISAFASNVEAIYSRHTLEHLTDEETRLTLDDWFSALRIGGTVEIIVPNMRFHIDQWLKANWKAEGPVGTKNIARWAFAGFYGWQRECNPRERGYNQSYWDVHKSGYDAGRIEYLLETSGFARIETEIVDECHLVARASKITQKNERQVAPRLDGIRADHKARYHLAEQFIPEGSIIADLACGTGYGSFILAHSGKVSKIVAIDIDQGAIEYARNYYNNEKIEFRVGDITEASFRPNSLDAIISFETIEHVKDHSALLKAFFSALRPGGLLMCSSPNEDVIPLSVMKNPYHFRHFTPSEFATSFEEVGFEILKRFTQTERDSERIDDGWHGLYNIAVCQKPAIMSA